MSEFTLTVGKGKKKSHRWDQIIYESHTRLYISYKNMKLRSIAGIHYLLNILMCAALSFLKKVYYSAHTFEDVLKQCLKFLHLLFIAFWFVTHYYYF